ncbi:hypothetical protein V7166_22305 [Bacillus thuringiensis]
MKCRLNLLFDWKSMGFVAYAPLLIFIFIFYYNSTVESNLHMIIPVLEYTIPAFSAWWSIFLLQDILEEEGTESILSYPVSRWNLGFIRLSIFFLIYVLLIASVIFTIQYQIENNIFFSLLYQLSIESFFFSGLGFLSMVLTTNSGWSLGIIILYVSTQILTKGSFFPFTNIYLFNDRILSLLNLLNWSIAVFVISCLCWLGAQVILNHFKKFY